MAEQATDVALLQDALALAGFAAGEVFELVRVTVLDHGGKRALCWRGVELAPAVRWVLQDVRDVYLRLNPITPEARSPRGAARAEDMAQARLLYVDCDPRGPEGRMDARALAYDVRTFVRDRWGVEVAVLSSGRGAGCWIRHEPLPPELAHEIRSLIAQGLALRLRRPQAFVDHSPFAANAASRLPGSTNSKTDEVVEVLERGDGREIPWSALVAFAQEVRDELPPPKAGPWKLPKELRQSVAEIEQSGRAEAWSWLGAAAGRRGVPDLVYELVPWDSQEAYERGRKDPNRRWQKPDLNGTSSTIETTLERLSRRFERANKAARAEEEIKVTRIVRRSRGVGLGSVFDLEISLGGELFQVRGIDGRTLRSYPLMSPIALEEGCLLPELGKEGRVVWARILEAAWKVAETRVEKAGTTHSAIVAAIRGWVVQQAQGRTTQHLAQGQKVDVGGRWAVSEPRLIDAVRGLMQGDLISREAIAEAGRELGAEIGVTVRVPCGISGEQVTRQQCWTFPASVREEA